VDTGGQRATVDARLAAALAGSTFGDLDDERRDALLVGSTRRLVPAGTSLRSEGTSGARLELIVDGFARIYVAAPDGRTLTVRYARSGSLFGAVSLYRPTYVLPGSIQAIVDSEILVFRPDVVRSLADRDLAVAGALLRELSDRVATFVSEIPGSAFATVRQRVARHLLDLASERQHGSRLVARISQQGLADSVGSVREVVVRVLGDLRREGLVETGAGQIVVIDPVRLYAETYHAAAGVGTQVPDTRPTVPQRHHTATRSRVTTGGTHHGRTDLHQPRRG